jgi:hypothetical protein
MYYRFLRLVVLLRVMQDLPGPENTRDDILADISGALNQVVFFRCADHRMTSIPSTPIWSLKPEKEGPRKN